MIAEEYFNSHKDKEWLDILSESEMNFLYRIMKDYAGLKCKEQRELCAKEYLEMNCEYDEYYAFKIKATKEPEL